MHPIYAAVLLLFLQFDLNSQPPVFAPFKGKVIEMPEDWKTKGYATFMDDLPTIQEIEWRKLDVKDRPTEEAFEDIEAPFSFGILFRSKMKIKAPAWYSFSLISDDGSRLWIDGHEVLNNDGDHKMRMASDTIALDTGIYDVKVWYYQAFALRYGLVFDADYIKPIEDKSQLYSFENQSFPFLTVYFDFAISDLDDESIKEIEKWVFTLEKERIKSVKVSGYADSKGSDAYNLDLSKRRAEKISHILGEFIDGSIISTEYHGENQNRKTGLDHKQQRRVTIEVVY